MRKIRFVHLRQTLKKCKNNLKKAIYYKVRLCLLKKNINSLWTWIRMLITIRHGMIFIWYFRFLMSRDLMRKVKNQAEKRKKLIVELIQTKLLKLNKKAANGMPLNSMKIMSWKLEGFLNLFMTLLSRNLHSILWNAKYLPPNWILV